MDHHSMYRPTISSSRRRAPSIRRFSPEFIMLESEVEVDEQVPTNSRIIDTKQQRDYAQNLSTSPSIPAPSPTSQIPHIVVPMLKKENSLPNEAPPRALSPPLVLPQSFPAARVSQKALAAKPPPPVVPTTASKPVAPTTTTANKQVAPATIATNKPIELTTTVTNKPVAPIPTTTSANVPVAPTTTTNKPVAPATAATTSNKPLSKPVASTSMTPPMTPILVKVPTPKSTVPLKIEAATHSVPQRTSPKMQSTTLPPKWAQRLGVPDSKVMADMERKRVYKLAKVRGAPESVRVFMCQHVITVKELEAKLKEEREQFERDLQVV